VTSSAALLRGRTYRVDLGAVSAGTMERVLTALVHVFGGR
jgi:hypothetical protein